MLSRFYGAPGAVPREIPDLFNPFKRARLASAGLPELVRAVTSSSTGIVTVESSRFYGAPGAFRVIAGFVEGAAVVLSRFYGAPGAVPRRRILLLRSSCAGLASTVLPEPFRGAGDGKDAIAWATSRFYGAPGAVPRRRVGALIGQRDRESRFYGVPGAVPRG